MAADIKFIVEVDSKKGTAVLKGLDKDVEKLAKSSKQTTSGFKGLWAQIGVGIVVVTGLMRSIRGVVRFMGDAISKAREQERVEKQLEIRLKSTAGAAGLAKDELLKLASGLQQVTTYGDEAIIGAEALLLTFTKIGRDAFPDALEIILDMSTAMGQDLKASALAVGKALNDPIIGVTALTRVGVSFTEQEKEKIKTLAASGKLLEAQTLILAELRTEFGGSSKDIDTFDGVVGQLSNTWGDFKEEIGATVTESEEFRDVMKSINGVLENMIKSGYLETWIERLEKVARFMDSVMHWSEGWKLLELKTLAARLELERLEKTAEDIVGAIRPVEEESEVMGDNFNYAARRAFALKMSLLELQMELDAWKLPQIVKSPEELLDQIGFTGLDETFQSEWDKTMYNSEERSNQWLNNQLENLGIFTGESKETAKDVHKTNAQFGRQAMMIGTQLASKSKELSLAMAVINTAAGVTQALKHYPPPLSFIMAALQAAAGAVQIGAIVSQSIPSAAEGAYLPRDTLIQAHRGEIVSPLPMMREVVREVIKEPGGAKTNIYIDVRDQIDPYSAQRITRDQIIPQILEALDSNQMRKTWQNRLRIR